MKISSTSKTCDKSDLVPYFLGIIEMEKESPKERWILRKSGSSNPEAPLFINGLGIVGLCAKHKQESIVDLIPFPGPSNFLLKQ